MATKNYLDYAGLKRVLKRLLPGARKIWHGTLTEWEALDATEKAKYDQAEVIDEYTGVPVVVDKVESGNLNPVTSNAVAKCIKLGEYVTAALTPLPANATVVNYMKVNLDKGKWIIRAHARADITNERTLLSMYVSQNADLSTGNVVVDQCDQMPGIWHFVDGAVVMTLTEAKTVFARLTNHSATQAINALDGTLYAIKVSD